MDELTANKNKRAWNPLNAINGLEVKYSLSRNLKIIADEIASHFSDISRVSVWVFDQQDSVIKSFLSTNKNQDPLARSEIHIQSMGDLLESVINNKGKKVVRPLSKTSENIIDQILIKEGYRSSYLSSIYQGESLIGLVALVSTQNNRFECPHVRSQSDAAIKLIELFVINEVSAIRRLKGVMKSLKDVAILRDNETGEHLERMSRYSRLIALQLADAFNFDDEFIEHIFQCSSLHDIGKIATPDNILLKQEKLTIAEYSEIKKHTVTGKEIILRVLENLQLKDSHFSNILLNIVISHHENWDGSGYPEGLKGKQIPFEARIVRVADAFDALTSKRPYKEAWPHAKTLKYLKDNSGTLFCPVCVQAVLALEGDFLKIYGRYQESNI